MKKISIIVLCFAVFGGYIFLNLDREIPVKEPNAALESGVKNPENGEVEIIQTITFQDSFVTTEKPKQLKVWDVDEQAFQNGQKKLSQIIEEFDKHLDNPQMREVLQEQLSRESEAYKQQVLAKVKNAIQSEKE